MTTAGLAAVRFLISKFATLKHGDARHCVTGVGAFLHGRARRPIFVHVLAEDAWCQEEKVLSILVGSLCAGSGWVLWSASEFGACSARSPWMPR